MGDITLSFNSKIFTFHCLASCVLWASATISTKETYQEYLSYEQDMVLSIFRFGIEIFIIEYTTLHHNIIPTRLENYVTPFNLDTIFLRRISYTIDELFSSIV
jgi:hypothetical protein